MLQGIVIIGSLTPWYLVCNIWLSHLKFTHPVLKILKKKNNPLPPYNVPEKIFPVQLNWLGQLFMSYSISSKTTELFEIVNMALPAGLYSPALMCIISTVTFNFP